MFNRVGFNPGLTRFSGVTLVPRLGGTTFDAGVQFNISDTFEGVRVGDKGETKPSTAADALTRQSSGPYFSDNINKHRVGGERQYQDLFLQTIDDSDLPENDKRKAKSAIEDSYFRDADIGVMGGSVKGYYEVAFRPTGAF